MSNAEIENVSSCIGKMILQNITKKYGSKTALNNINLTICDGEILGYIGPNGAGKSTTLRIIAGLDTCYDGKIQFNGNSLIVTSEYLSQIGYMPQSMSFAPWRTVKETLQLFGKLSGLRGDCLDKRIDEVIEFVDLKNDLSLRCNALSGGMAQRLNLAQALLHEPGFVILDEPFSNLDPIGRTELKKIILNLKNKGKTILFSSHILSDVEELADRVAIINDAALLFQGRISELSKRAIKELSFFVGLYAPVEITKFQNLHNGILSMTQLKPCLYKIIFKPELLPQQQEIASALLNAMLSSDFKIKEFNVVGHTLDEMFVSILGERP